MICHTVEINEAASNKNKVLHDLVDAGVYDGCFLRDDKGIWGFKYNKHIYPIRPDAVKTIPYAAMEDPALLHTIPVKMPLSNAIEGRLMYSCISDEAKRISEIVNGQEGLSQRQKRGKICGWAQNSGEKTCNIMLKTLYSWGDQRYLSIARKFHFQLRYNIYVLLCVHGERFEQICSTFPAIAILCAHERSHFDDYEKDKGDIWDGVFDISSQRAFPFDFPKLLREHIKTSSTPIIEMVMRGWKTKDIAKKIDLDRRLRSFHPMVWGREYNDFFLDWGGDREKNKVSDTWFNLIPKKVPQQKFWRKLLKVNDKNKLVWARNNIAKLTNLYGVREADIFIDWISHVVLENEDREILFVEGLSFENAVERETIWHERFGAANGAVFGYDEEDVLATTFPEEPFEKMIFEKEDVEIIPVNSPIDIIVESRKMKHCVASYAKKVGNGDCYIYSLREKNKRKVTIEIRDNGEAWSISQARGPCNDPISRQHFNAIKKWAKDNNVVISGNISIIGQDKKRTRLERLRQQR